MAMKFKIHLNRKKTRFELYFGDYRNTQRWMNKTYPNTDSKIGQSSHKIYSNNILNFQESTTILNTCIKKILESYWLHHVTFEICELHTFVTFNSRFPITISYFFIKEKTGRTHFHVGTKFFFKDITLYKGITPVWMSIQSWCCTLS